MIEAIGAGTARQMGGSKDWADRWAESEEHAKNQREISALKQDSQAKTNEETITLAKSCTSLSLGAHSNW